MIPHEHLESYEIGFIGLFAPYAFFKQQKTSSYCFAVLLFCILGVILCFIFRTRKSNKDFKIMSVELNHETENCLQKSQDSSCKIRP